MAVKIPFNPEQRREVERIEGAILNDPAQFFDDERTRLQREAGKLYLEKLFELNPDDELLARMWETDPETMRRLMPEIGNETEEQIDTEMTRWQSYAYTAANSLRITLDRDIRLTPRQRMREALLRLQEND